MDNSHDKEIAIAKVFFTLTVLTLLAIVVIPIAVIDQVVGGDV